MSETPSQQQALSHKIKMVTLFASFTVINTSNYIFAAFMSLQEVTTKDGEVTYFRHPVF